MGKEGYLPLSETEPAKGRKLYWSYAVSMLVGISLIFCYRVIHAPQVGRHAWIGLSISELWFTLYWFVTQSVRWNPVYHRTFKDRLSHRYEKILPGIDIFVSTADAVIEPPIMVINTVLSVMAYDYPPEKLSVYLSDDGGGSELMFYALLEASHFSKYWLPFCRKFKIEPRSPAAYISTVPEPLNNNPPIYKEWSAIKKLYEEMKSRIDSCTKLGHISEEQREGHKGLHEWDIALNKRDHQAIIQILIDGRDTSKAVDIDRQPLPTLVYMAREKRPQYHHNFKAGAMNALIRVSSKISNSPIILTVDCDMYSNNPESVRDALCFFMDEESSHQIAFVQFPQKFDNLTKDEIYSGAMRVLFELEMGNWDSNGGTPNVGTGCFHKRDTLCGKIYNKESKTDWTDVKNERGEERLDMLEETCKVLASSSYEQNTQWGNEMGVKYGCAVEDVVTGLLIHCRGWKSVYFNPEKAGFLGVAPTTLLQTLVQYKRWAEGNLQIFLSRHCPIVYGHGRIPLKLQVSYCCWELWAPNGSPSLYYVVIPSLSLLRGISLFPKVSSLWIVPFLWVMIIQYAYSLVEFISCGGTSKEWWNEQRMRLFRTMTSYVFAFKETTLKKLGFSESGFIVTPKVADDDVSQRYMKSVIEFGTPSSMFTIIASVAMLNLFSFIWGLKNAAMDFHIRNMVPMVLQILLCGILVLINLPVYDGLFFRKDRGSMPASVTCKSAMLALLALYNSLVLKSTYVNTPSVPKEELLYTTDVIRM